MGVRVHVASLNTAPSTELCIRSMHRFAGHPFNLTVGDSGSSDGTAGVLGSFESRGWLTLEVAPEGRKHAEWLDDWFRRCDARFAVFVDSDVEFRTEGWLADLIEQATGSGDAIVCAEMLSGTPNFVEPVGHKLVRLAARPAPWLLMIDVEQTSGLSAGFGFASELTDTVTQGIGPGPTGRAAVVVIQSSSCVAYDVGALFLGEAREKSLRWVEMPHSYRRKCHDYGGSPGSRSRGEGAARS